jgi:hypothetical protein
MGSTFSSYSHAISNDGFQDSGGKGRREGKSISWCEITWAASVFYLTVFNLRSDSCRGTFLFVVFHFANFFHESIALYLLERFCNSVYHPSTPSSSLCRARCAINRLSVLYTYLSPAHVSPLCSSILKIYVPIDLPPNLPPPRFRQKYTRYPEPPVVPKRAGARQVPKGF